MQFGLRRTLHVVGKMVNLRMGPRPVYVGVGVAHQGWNPWDALPAPTADAIVKYHQLSRRRLPALDIQVR